MHEAKRDPPPRAQEPPRSGEVASVAGQAVLAEQVFPLMYLSHPDEAREAVRQAVIEKLIELETARTGVAIAAELVDHQMEKVIGDFEEQVRVSTAGAQGAEAYVRERFGVSYELYRRWVRRSVSNSLLLERLILFELLRLPRVQVRLIRVASRELADELLAKVQRGADFGRLARAHSEDVSAEEGGLYPALPTSVGYPLLDGIRHLRSGDFDEVRAVLDEGKELGYRVLQLMARMPAKEGSWPELAPFIERELQARTVSELELDAWMRIVEDRHRVRFHGIGTESSGDEE